MIVELGGWGSMFRPWQGDANSTKIQAISKKTLHHITGGLSQLLAEHPRNTNVEVFCLTALFFLFGFCNASLIV